MRRVITSSTAEEFAAAFMDSHFSVPEGFVFPESPDSHLSSFYATCSEILDTIAPFKRRSTKPRVDAWLNDSTRALRQRCRQAERQWRKDKLHVSLGILRDSLAHYQRGGETGKMPISIGYYFK